MGPERQSRHGGDKENLHLPGIEPQTSCLLCSHYMFSIIIHIFKSGETPKHLHFRAATLKMTTYFKAVFIFPLLNLPVCYLFTQETHGLHLGQFSAGV